MKLYSVANDFMIKIASYEMLCQANLRSDMANRVMYSVLPFVQENFSFDYTTCNLAISGREDVIKYGTIACIKELHSYKGDKSLIHKGLSFINSGDYESAINIAIACYSDYANWKMGWGNKSWERIARTIKDIINGDKKLKEIKTILESSHNPKLFKEQEQIMKELIVNLNIFDSLSHNNGSIMNKLIMHELEDRYGEANSDRLKKEISGITRIMDSKELTDTIGVYKEIEKELDINLPFKEWITKIRNHPDYFKSVNKNELFKIRCRKVISPYVGRLKDNVNLLKPQMKLLTNSSLNSFIKNFNSIIGSLRGNLVQITLALGAVKNDMPDIDFEINSLIKEIESVKNKLAADISIFTRLITTCYEDGLTVENRNKLIVAGDNLMKTIDDIFNFVSEI